MSENNSIDHRRLPRKKRPISARDQAIFIAYRAHGRTQVQLARQFQLSQRRICTIIQRVAQAQASDDDAAPFCQLEIARACAEQLYTAALRAYDQAPVELTTTQTGRRGQSPFNITTRRQLPPNHHFLKAALTASNTLALLAIQPPSSSTTNQFAPDSNRSKGSNPAPAAFTEIPSRQ